MDTRTFNQRFQILTQKERKIDDKTIIENTESVVNVVDGQLELSTIRVSIIRHMNHDSFFDKTVEGYITHKLIEKDTHEEYFASFTPNENFIVDYLDQRFNLIHDEWIAHPETESEPSANYTNQCVTTHTQ